MTVYVVGRIYDYLGDMWQVILQNCDCNIHAYVLCCNGKGNGVLDPKGTLTHSGALTPIRNLLGN